jgi:hypothetical protein
MGTGELRHRQHVKSVRVAATLADGPRTLEEISDRYFAYLRALGFFRMGERLVRNRMASMERRLAEPIKRGWVIHDNEYYALTPVGRKEVEERLLQLGETGALLRRSLQPRTVSKVTLGIHLGLAALKLPAGILSGSVALINDAADTLLDALSSLVVNREQAHPHGFAAAGPTNLTGVDIGRQNRKPHAAGRSA